MLCLSFNLKRRILAIMGAIVRAIPHPICVLTLTQKRCPILTKSYSGVQSTKCNFVEFTLVAAIVIVITFVVKVSMEKEKLQTSFWVKSALGVGIPAMLYILYLTNKTVQFTFRFSRDSISILLVIFALVEFNTWIMKTKLGHDFRAVGQNCVIAEVAGINVDKTRSIAMVFSTTPAGFGQIIHLQDIDTINTYQPQLPLLLLFWSAAQPLQSQRTSRYLCLITFCGAGHFIPYSKMERLCKNSLSILLCHTA